MSYLTDKEKRLLFSALSREKVICQQLDDSSGEYENRVKLAPIVESLERKFYYDRFEKEIRNKAIACVVNKALEQFTALEIEDSYATVTECKIILKEIAERMKEVEE